MLSLSFLASLAVACGNEIGDACQNALDCSPSGSRQCDLTQPAGYCTVDGCEEGSCPEESVCVLFGRKADGQFVDRLSRTYCMYKCDDRSDCRDDEGYECFRASDTRRNDDPFFGSGNEARILGDKDQKFCAPKAQVAPNPRGGERTSRGGTSGRSGAGSGDAAAGEGGAGEGGAAGEADAGAAGAPMMSVPDGG